MWLLFIQNHWKKFLCLGVMLACFGGGAYTGDKFAKPKIQVQEKIVEKEKIVTVEIEKKQIKTKKKTVIVTTPDGTKTETTTENTETKEEKSASATKESEKTTAKATALSKYHLGAFASRSTDDLMKTPLSAPNLGISAGTRIWGPTWAETSYNFGTKDLSIGLSIEF